MTRIIIPVAALVLVTLARKLNLEANLEEAQESVYEALKRGMPATEELRELSVVLGLAPGLLTRSELTISSDDLNVNAAEAALP